jgi:3-oxoacyl-[acyl-carrier protein] reductase
LQLYADRNIRANAVSPGPIASPRQDEMIRAAGKNPAEAIPLKRFGEVREVADAVVFLVSDRSDYITGSVLQVDGGAILAL